MGRSFGLEGTGGWLHADGDAGTALPHWLSAADTADPAGDAIERGFGVGRSVDDERDLIGRTEALALLDLVVREQQRHGILAGSRRSGRTSLAQVFGGRMDAAGMIALYAAATPGMAFADLLRPCLRHLPDEALRSGMAGDFAARIGAARGPGDLVGALSLIGDGRVLLILDDVDALDAAGLRDVATFAKALTDARVPVTLLIVGDVCTAEGLVAAHPSLRRNSDVIALGGLAAEAVAAMLDRGAVRAGLHLAAAARDRIVRVACGSPYHARLFACHAARAAVRSGRPVVDDVATALGLSAAFDDWAAGQPQDAQLFQRLAATDAPTRRAIADMARSIALGDRAAADTARMSSELRDLRQRMFEGEAAPQWLLVAVDRVERDAPIAPVEPLVRDLVTICDYQGSPMVAQVPRPMHDRRR